MRAVQITEFGGPEVLTLTEVPDPVADGGLELVEVSSAGVNYADTHQVENSYLSASTLPMIPGAEVVGTLADGSRVAALTMSGGYCEKTLAHPQMAFPLPDDVTDGQALALMVQGLTAWHLLRTCTHLQPGESVVVHAAAGGVGTLAIQLAKQWGAGRVIAVASSDEKLKLAAELGADVGVLAGADDLKKALEEANGGRKVDVVLEMVGGETFERSLSAVAHFGRLVHFGQSARQGAPKVSPGKLMATSRGVIGFWLMHLISEPDRLGEALDDMFAAISAGELEVIVGDTYPLEEARRAHEDIRTRRTTGKLVLVP